MMRYFPAKCTAGLARSLVRGCSREPWPPARIMANRFSIVIQPWDASQIGNIEKAIYKSDLGITPSSDGKVIRLVMPTLTEERRKQLAKAVGKLAEDARVSVRNVRREANDKLKALAKEKKLSEDEERRAHDQIQKATDRFTARIEELTKKKEQEVLTV